MKTLEIYSIEESSEMLRPLVGEVVAGFPSPAENYSEQELDLNRLMIRNPDSTYLVRVTAHEMTGDRINYGDMLVASRDGRESRDLPDRW